jgi:hypothetical protein
MTADTHEQLWKSYLDAYGPVEADERERLLRQSATDDFVFTMKADDSALWLASSSAIQRAYWVSFRVLLEGNRSERDLIGPRSGTCQSVAAFRTRQARRVRRVIVDDDAD